MGASSAIAARAALTQQTVALSVLRQTAELQQQTMAVLLESVVSVPVSGTRGVSVNLSA